MKARLEIEMPECCGACIACETDYRKGDDFFHYCYSTNIELKEIYGNKPDWCPLEPVLTVGDYVKGEE